MKNSLKVLLFSVFVASLMLVQSCSKDELTPSKPALQSTGLPDNKTELNVGESVKIVPVYGTGDRPATYIWKVNDRIVSDDVSYTYNATQYGVFKVVLVVVNGEGTQTIEYTITVKAPYQDGFFILNEGWFGHDKGSVNFWHTGTDTVDTNIFTKNNPGKSLGESTQFGAIYNDHLYLVSKKSPSLVVTEAKTMKETGRIESLPADARAFLAVDANNALVSTADGVYIVKLNPLALGDKIAGVDGQVGSMIKSGNRIFLYGETQGVVVVNASTWTVEEEIGAATDAFVESNDGGIWYAYQNGLVKLDPATLVADTIPVSVDIPGQYALGAWYAGSLAYSKVDNAIYFLNDGGFTGSTIVYRQVLTDDTFLDDPFITLPAERVFYSAGIRINPATNEIVATTVQSGFGDNSKLNDLVFYNASTGAEVKKVSYEGFWFPSVTVFYEPI